MLIIPALEEAFAGPDLYRHGVDRRWRCQPSALRLAEQPVGLLHLMAGRERIPGMVIAAVIVVGVAIAVRSWIPIVIVVLAAVPLRLTTPSIVRQREEDAEWIEERRPTPGAR